MKRLLEGILEFRRNLTPEKREAFARMARTQQPDALLVACSDSRVVPNLFASTHPGEVFVVRNAGNIVPEWAPEKAGGVTASICYALEMLPIQDLVICGHSQCGAMAALLNPGSAGCEVGMSHWLRHGPEPPGRHAALQALPEDAVDRMSQVNVLRQMDHVLSFPSVQQRLREGRLRVHGWWFDIEHAEVHAFKPSSGRFDPIDESTVAGLLWEHELRA